jgi:hypothetical protein
MILPLSLFIFGLVFFAVTIALFKRFDAMIRRIYDGDRDRWLELGGPTGYFWHPKEKRSFFRSFLARDALLFSFIGAGLKEPKKSVQRTPGNASSTSAESGPRRP